MTPTPVSVLRRVARIVTLHAAIALAALITSQPAVAQQGAQKFPVAAIEIQGSQRVLESAILATLRFGVGDSIGNEEINRAMKYLFASGQFDDVAIDAMPAANPDSLILHITVEERPIVSAIDFLGLEHVRASAVRDTVGLRVGDPLDPGAIITAKATIRSMLARRGYYVRSIEDRFETEPDQPNIGRLTFLVEEGERISIAQLEFTGNAAFGQEELTGVVSTKPEAFLWSRTGVYDEEKLRTDIRQNLPTFYARNGYLEARVLGDSLVVDPETGKARLILDIEEGVRYELADFEIVGNRVFSSDVLRAYFSQQRGGLLRGLGIGVGGDRQDVGEAFDLVAFQEATQQVTALYRNSGFLDTQVIPQVQPIPEEQWPNGRPAVRASWNIIEGQQAFINQVHIIGNTYTHDDVIRSQITVIPGDVYSDDRILQSFQRISALGFFEVPLPLPQINRAQNGDVDIIFEVEEKNTGAVNFGATLGGVSGIAGFVGYEQPNLFGRAKSGYFRWEFGRYSNNLELRYSDPAIMGTRYSGAISLFNMRDRFSPFRDGQRRQLGASLRFGLPLPTDLRNSRLTLGYSLSRTTYEEFDQDVSSLFSLPPGIKSTITLGMTRTTLDHPTFPTVGTRFEILADLSGGILGGDGDFQKYTLSSAWWVPIGELGSGTAGSSPIRLALGLTGEAGAITGDASRFPFERFWMGGVQFGRSLRGYDETTVTPLGVFEENASGIELDQRFGDAFMKLSAELAMRLTDGISVGAFFDAGNVWRTTRYMNPSRLVRGAGFGATLVTPFGPIGIDIAYGFDKADPGWIMHFKFGGGF